MGQAERREQGAARRIFVHRTMDGIGSRARTLGKALEQHRLEKAWQPSWRGCEGGGGEESAGLPSATAVC
jgi:hypothetical protein